MTYKEVAAMIAETNIANAYYQFDEGTGQQPPFICFFYDYSDDMLADNSNYQKIEHLIIELYTEQKDFSLMSTLEAVLGSHDLVYTRSSEYIDSEKMQLEVYEMDVLITAETPTNEAETPVNTEEDNEQQS